MTRPLRTIVVLALILHQSCHPSGPLQYIDTDVPDSIPKIFAPGIVSLKSRLEQNLTISSDGSEYVFGITDSSWDYTGILTVKLTNGKVCLDTTVKYVDINHCGEPFLSRDGEGLLFVGNYPFDLWKCSREGNGWASPVRLEPPINTAFLEVHPSLAANGTLYFASTRDGKSGLAGEGAIYSATLTDGQYSKVNKLEGDINLGDAGDPAVSADESFIVFASFRSGGYGETDLYISFRLENTSWTTPKNLGRNINTIAHEAGPFLSHDGEYLFFHRRERWKDPTYSDIYWVSTDVLRRR